MSSPLRVVITGGSGGLGSAAAQVLRDQGHRVLTADLAQGDVSEECFVRHDVGDEESWNHLLDEAVQRMGGVDCLINNAGISEQSGVKGLIDTDGDAFSRVLQVNLWGAWCGIKTFAGSLAQSDCASIINVSSVYGYRPPPRGGEGARVSPAYQVSKAGVAMLTRTAASELAEHGITVNSVSPGVFETHLLARLPEEVLALRINAAPLKRAGEPTEFGELIAFLAGPNARFITGANVPVDGGFLAA